MMRGKPLGVDTVVVDGEVILSGERFTRIDEVAVMTELAETLAGPRSEDEEHRRKMAQRTVTYTEKFIQVWLDDDPMKP